MAGEVVIRYQDLSFPYNFSVVEANIPSGSLGIAMDQIFNYTIDKIFSTEPLYDVPVYLIVFLAVAYGTVSLSAVIGNAVVLWIVVRSRKLRTVTNFFIANLAIADILIGALAVPFQFHAALLQRWVLPNFMCAFCPFVQIVCVNVSIFTLTAIAADRYLLVVHPIHRKITKDKAKVIIGLIWMVAVVAATPAAIALRVTMVPDIENTISSNEDILFLMTNSNFSTFASNFSIPLKPFCNNVGLDPSLWKHYNHALVGVQYFIPLFVICFAYGKMGLKLRGGHSAIPTRKFSANSPTYCHTLSETSPSHSNARCLNNNGHNEYRAANPQNPSHSQPQIQAQEQNLNPNAEYIVINKKKVIKMLFIVVALFAFCWLPLQTYNFLQDIFPEINEFRYINVIWFCCHWLAMSNSCVNPFIYAIYTLAN